jgi:hypothetical protein
MGTARQIAGLHGRKLHKGIFRSKKFIKVISAPLLAGLVATFQAQAAENLTGWGAFKFGMSVDQARALPAPGQAWKYFPPLSFPALDKISNLSSKGPISAFGAEFDSASMSFEAGKGLTWIYLDREQRASAEDCEKSFQALVTNLEVQYGSFIPGYRSFTGADVRQVPGSKSRYQQYAGGPFNGVTEYLDARREISGRYLDVSAVIGQEARCSMGMNFRPSSPQGADAPAYRRADGSYGGRTD